MVSQKTSYLINIKTGLAQETTLIKTNPRVGGQKVIYSGEKLYTHCLLKHVQHKLQGRQKPGIVPRCSLANEGELGWLSTPDPFHSIGCILLLTPY